MPQALAGQNLGAEFVDRVVTVGGAEHRYHVYVPAGFTAHGDWPVVLYLHGGPRRLESPGPPEGGLANAIRNAPDRWPVVAVFPVAPIGATWQGDGAKVAMSALEATLAEFDTDASRVYVTGISMGGAGAWSLAAANLDRFAAIVPIAAPTASLVRDFAGASELELAYRAYSFPLSRTPAWIFHGENDLVVLAEESQSMATALRSHGAPVRYTELRGVGHNSWDAAYALDELPTWILSQHRR